MTERRCECGCGQVLEGAASCRFVDNADRMRARRGRRVEPESFVGEIPRVGPPSSNGLRAGPVRGLEVWIGGQNIAPPEALTSAARALADEAEHAPDNSPL